MKNGIYTVSSSNEMTPHILVVVKDGDAVCYSIGYNGDCAFWEMYGHPELPIDVSNYGDDEYFDAVAAITNVQWDDIRVDYYDIAFDAFPPHVAIEDSNDILCWWEETFTN